LLHVPGVPNQIAEHIGLGMVDHVNLLGVLAKHQPLEHGFVNDAARYFFIGSDRLEACGIYCGRNKICVNRAEIHNDACSIGFIAKGHEDKPEWFHLRLPPREFRIAFVTEDVGKGCHKQADHKKR
jgi:hypothetical protein